MDKCTTSAMSLLGRKHLGGDGLLMRAYILQFKFFIALKLEMQVFPEVSKADLIITLYFKANYS